MDYHKQVEGSFLAETIFCSRMSINMHAICVPSVAKLEKKQLLVIKYNLTY